MVRTTKSPTGKVRIVSVSLTPEIAAKLDKYCAERERSRSRVIEKLISRYLEKMP